MKQELLNFEVENCGDCPSKSRCVDVQGCYLSTQATTITKAAQAINETTNKIMEMQKELDEKNELIKNLRIELEAKYKCLKKPR